MSTPEHAYDRIEKLIHNFKALTAGQRKSMNENATRQGYILPLFAALGWDIGNVNEVSPEEKVSRGFVDFSFRLDGVPRFFLETKKASEDLNDPRWVKQSIDYAWTKNVTWALLSDFEGLRVFNAEWKESNPFRAEFLQFNLESYLSDFERLLWLSREQTAAGRLSSEAEKVGKKARRLPVSQHLFDDLKSWRADLFRDLKGFNPLYSAAQVDEAVLRLLNRLIFIRTAEDRQVEPNRLRALVRELKDKKQFSNLWVELNKLFREMDGIYNSELFARHFSEELYVTPTVLENVIEGLYEANYIGYNFNAIESDVLGTAYEQYLGSMVTQSQDEAPPGSANQPYLMPQPAMTVQERRQKRKSQGIYYTPAFVTKYIVQQTLGRWLQENDYSPSHPPRILDMACGSGSFLIEAFDVLDAFVARQRGHAYGSHEELHDAARRLELLTTCIYGVDKDKQAVDVARLNLLLRALHSREKLPMLHNIHHADSLKPETWADFSEVMNEGGFDIIIGNPPYVRQETLGAEFKEFAQSKFETYTGTADLYIYFIEQAHKLLKPGGLFGMIVSNKWMRSNYGKALRSFLSQYATILEIIDFNELPVFGDVIAYPTILITRTIKSKKQSFLYAQIDNLEFTNLSTEVTTHGVILEKFTKQGDNWIFGKNQDQIILDQLRTKSDLLGTYIGSKIFRGVLTGLNDAFIIDRSAYERFIQDNPKASEFIKPFLMGRDVQEYFVGFREIFLIRVPKGYTNANKPETVDAWEWFLETFPALAKYLHPFSISAEKRLDKGDYWWELRACGYYDEFEKIKIIAPAIVKNATFALDDQGFYSNDKTSIIPTDDLFLLGILNSTIMDFVLKRIASTKQGGYFEQKPMYISQLPIHKLNSEDPAERAAHDAIVEKVEQMLALNKQLAQAERDLDDSRHSLGQKIQSLDIEIDALVYGLYGLTEEEIKVVEGK